MIKEQLISNSVQHSGP